MGKRANLDTTKKKKKKAAIDSFDVKCCVYCVSNKVTRRKLTCFLTERLRASWYFRPFPILVFFACFSIPRSKQKRTAIFSFTSLTYLRRDFTGNDPELDPNRAPEPPTKALDKPAPRVGKRDAPKEAPSQPRENTGRRGQRFQGNEAGMSVIP